MRKLPALVVTAVLVASLTACAAAPAFVETCAPTGNAALVAAPGSLGSDPRASFPTPLVATAVEVAELTAGGGRQVEATDAVDMSISVYDGATGEPVTDGTGDLIATELSLFVDNSLPFTQALTCASAGSRLVVVGSGEQLLGADPQVTYVLVIDVVDAFAGQATGAEQWVPGGFPAVVFAPDGEPGFTFPAGAPPADLGIAALRQGSGSEVTTGDEIFVNLTGIVWGGTVTFASTFANESPGILLAQERSTDGSGVVPGLAEALVGQRVGSRLLVVVPPSEGYAPGTAPGTIGENDTIVFVVDILAIR